MIRFLALVPLLWLAGGVAANETTERASRQFTLVYQAAVDTVPEGARQLRLWVPIPISTPEQEVGKVTCTILIGDEQVTVPLDQTALLDAVGTTPVKCVLAPIRHGGGMSLCVETPGKPFFLGVSSEIKRYETEDGGTATPEQLKSAKGADKMVVLGGKASANAKAIEDGADATETARRLYQHTLERMKYDKPAGGDWGRGDSEWACDSRYGNCTDFHSYFMALARTKGIPARFEMGFPVPGGDEPEAAIGGYHCWAFFWDGAKWRPVDISEADKHPEKAEYFFGTLDADRVTMTQGRDLILTPAPAAGPLNFFVYPYAEVDGKEWKQVDKSFKRING